MALKAHEAAGVVPDVTIELVERFRSLHRSVKSAPTIDQGKARLRLLYQSGTRLTQRSNDLVSKMERGQKWLDTHKDHPQHRSREDEWIAWLKEYEFLQDALNDAKDVL